MKAVTGSSSISRVSQRAAVRWKRGRFRFVKSSPSFGRKAFCMAQRERFVTFGKAQRERFGAFVKAQRETRKRL